MFSGMKLSNIETKNGESLDSSRPTVSPQLINAQDEEKEENIGNKTSGFSFIDSSSEPASTDKKDDDVKDSSTKTLTDEQLDPYHSNASASKSRNNFSLDLDGLEFTASTEENYVETSKSSFNFIKHAEADVQEDSPKNEDVDGTCFDEGPTDGEELELMDEEHLELEERVERLQLSSTSKSKKEWNIYEHVDDLTRESICSVMQLLDKQSLMNDLELSEKQALQDEDYEKAEELNTNMEQIKIELREHTIIQPHTHANYAWLLTNLNQLTNEEILRQENEAELAKQLQIEIRKKNEEVADKKRHSEQDTELELQKRKQKLATAKGHLKLDQEDLLKCETLLEDRIGEETKDFQANKSILELQQQCIKDEIEELLKKLASLRKQEEEIHQSIDEQDKLIRKTREGFAIEIKQLECDKDEIRKREHELRTTEHNLMVDEEDLKSESKCYDEEECKYEALLAVIEDVIQANQLNLEGLKKSSSQLIPDLTAGTLQSNPSQCITKLQEAAFDGIQGIKSGTSLMIFRQTEVTLQAKTLATLQCHIEEIELAKQAAVQGKNFAEAKKLSIELKSMSEEVDAVKNQLDGSRHSLEGIKKDLLEARKEQDEIETQLKDKEREQDKEQLELACVAFHNLKELTPPDSHQPMVELILQAEIQTCCLWMRYLCRRLNVTLYDEAEMYLEQHPVSRDLLKTEQQQERQEAMKLVKSLQKSLQTAIEEENYDAAESIQLEIETLEAVL